LRTSPDEFGAITIACSTCTIFTDCLPTIQLLGNSLTSVCQVHQKGSEMTVSG
jgi:hypothetical protein